MPGGTTGVCATVATVRARARRGSRVDRRPEERDRAAGAAAGRRRRAAASTCRRRSGPITVTHSPAARRARSTPRRIEAPSRARTVQARAPRWRPSRDHPPAPCAARARRTAPPTNAVTTPIGISAGRGDGARRPGRPAPGTPRRTASTAAGSPGSCVPASSRTMCGTMMPTKPISPDTDDRRRGAQRRGGDQDVAGTAAGAGPRPARLVVADRRARRARGAAAAPRPR